LDQSREDRRDVEVPYEHAVAAQQERHAPLLDWDVVALGYFVEERVPRGLKGVHQQERQPAVLQDVARRALIEHGLAADLREDPRQILLNHLVAVRTRGGVEQHRTHRVPLSRERDGQRRRHQQPRHRRAQCHRRTHHARLSRVVA
jgi:hypothetical protein